MNVDQLSDDTIITLYYCLGISVVFLLAAGLADALEYIAQRNRNKRK